MQQVSLFGGPPAKSAVISPCERFRYRLERVLRERGPTAAVIMVNPSTADAVTDDATIRKLEGFGNALGWRRFVVGNLFARRAKDVNALKAVVDPVGPENYLWLGSIMTEADVVIFAWGASAKLPKRLRDGWRWAADTALALGHSPQCWGTAADGHPLMIPYRSELRPWTRTQ